MTEFALDGLDGANPLAFLAAIGTLRTADRCWPNAAARLRWELTGAGWRARLVLDAALDEEALASRLASVLTDGDRAFLIGEDLRLSQEYFAARVKEAWAAATPFSRSMADFLAAFGSEALSERDGGAPTGLIADTSIRAVGGGQQRFLASIQQLVEITDDQHIAAAVFRPWTYSDDKPSLRWDPADDRRYALRWKEPSGDPIRTVRGANRLAVEALPLLPTAPVGTNLETTGFRRRRGEGVAFTWPVWTVPVRVDTVRSLLSFAELQKDKPDGRVLHAMGIAELYRSRRLTLGKYRNFSQATPVVTG